MEPYERAGGHAAGEIASTLAARTVHQEIRRFADAQQKLAAKGLRREATAKEILRVLEVAVHTASAKINAAAVQDPSKRGMGTTLSLLWVIGSNGYVAHVGDSRIYLERAGRLYQITDDHTVGKELLRLGMATPENLQRLPQNALTRAAGVHAHVQVDTLALELLPADQFLIASDGLTGYLDDPSQLVPQLGDATARIYANEGIAQLIFLGGSEVCEVSYADKSGKYQAQRGITLPRM